MARVMELKGLSISTEPTSRSGDAANLESMPIGDNEPRVLCTPPATESMVAIGEEIGRK